MSKKIFKRVVSFCLVWIVIMSIAGGCVAKKTQKSYLNEWAKVNKSDNNRLGSNFEDGFELGSVSSQYLQLKKYLEGVGKKMAFFYPLIAPFPLVLLMLTPIFLVMQLVNNRPEYFWMWNFCLWLGWILAGLAALIGYLDVDDQILELRHRASSGLVFWISGLALGFRILTARWMFTLWYKSILLTLLLLSALMAFYTQYLVNPFNSF